MDITLIDCLAAMRHNDRISARSLLRQYVAGQPDDPAGWCLLSQIAEDPAEGMQCLQRVLETAPAGRKAGSVPPTASAEPAKRQSEAISTATRPSRPPRPVSTGTVVRRESGPEIGPATAPVIGRMTWPMTRRMVRPVLTGAGYSLIVGVLCVLAAAILPMFFGRRTLVILSGSMAPAIPAGSAVVVSPVPSARLVVGDVIAYAPDGAKIPIVHRIVSIRQADGAHHSVTRGDANGSDDPAEFTLPETAWRVWYSVPLAGYMIAFASSRAGMVMLVVVPALLLGLLQAVEWLKTHRREQWLRLIGWQGQVLCAITRWGEALRQEGLRRAEQLKKWLEAQPDYGAGLQPIAAWFKTLEPEHRYATHVAARWTTWRLRLRRGAQRAAHWADLRLEPLTDANLLASWRRITARLKGIGIAVHLPAWPAEVLLHAKWPQWLRAQPGLKTGRPEPS